MDSWRRWASYHEDFGSINAAASDATATIVTLAAGDRLLVHEAIITSTGAIEAVIEVQVAGSTVLTYGVGAGLGGTLKATGLHGDSYNEIVSAAGGALTVKVTNPLAATIANVRVTLQYAAGDFSP